MLERQQIQRKKKFFLFFFLLLYIICIFFLFLFHIFFIYSFFQIFPFMTAYIFYHFFTFFSISGTVTVKSLYLLIGYLKNPKKCDIIRPYDYMKTSVFQTTVRLMDFTKFSLISRKWKQDFFLLYRKKSTIQQTCTVSPSCTNPQTCYCIGKLDRTLIYISI